MIPEVKYFFISETGGRNVNENPFLLSIGVIWFRHHNYLARTLGAANPNWTDEQVFNEARIRNVATYQASIVTSVGYHVTLKRDL